MTESEFFGNDNVVSEQEFFGSAPPKPTQPMPNGYRMDGNALVRDVETSSNAMFPEKQYEKWRKKGKISWLEIASQRDWTRNIPFVAGATQIAENLSIKSAVDRYKEDTYGNPAEKQKDWETIKEYARPIEEARTRGVSWQGKVYDGVADLFPMMIEFLATSGAYTAGRKVAVTATEKALGKFTENMVGKLVTRSTGLAVGSFAQNAVLVNQYIPKFQENMIASNLAITDKGMQFVENAQINPASAFVSAFADTWIENASERVGSEFFSPASRYIGRNVITKLSPKTQKAFQRLGGMLADNKVAGMLRKAGYDGIAEEWGEGRVVDILRGAFNISDTEGNVVERILKEFPDVEDALVELGIFAVPGAVSASSKLIKKRMLARGAKIDQINNLDRSTSENEKISWLKQDDAKRDDIFKTATIKLSNDVPLSPTEEVVIEERYGEYLETVALDEQPDANTAQEKVDALTRDDLRTEELLDFKEIEKEVNGKQVNIGQKYIDAEREVSKRIADKGTFEEILDSEQKLLDALVEEESTLRTRIADATGGATLLANEEVTRGAEDYVVEDIHNNAMTQLANEYHLDTPEELQLYRRSLNNKITEMEDLTTRLQDSIDLSKGKPIARTRIKEIKNAVSAFKTGISRGIKNTKQTLKIYQEKFTELLEGSGLEQKDQAKFMRGIAKVNSIENLEKVANAFEKKADKIFMKNEVRRLGVAIKKSFKALKTVKVGGLGGVSRFDYKTTKELQELRDMQKMSQQDAADVLVRETGDPQNQFDRIRLTMLEYKAMGDKASPELLAQVLNDLNTIQRLGKEAKSAEMWENKLSKQEEISDVVEKLKDTKVNRKIVLEEQDGELVEVGDKPKEGGLYKTFVKLGLHSFGDIYTKLNALVGGKLAETLNTEMQENSRDIAFMQIKKNAEQKASEIYGVNNPHKTMMELAEQLFDFVGMSGKVKLSKFELMDVYLSNKNPATKERFIREFGKEQLQTMEDSLDAKDKRFADYLMQETQKQWSVLNERHIQLTGRELGIRDFYWPRTSRNSNDPYDGIRRGSQNPSAMKKSTDQVLSPVIQSAWTKFTNHSSQAEHTRHLTPQYEKLMRIFGSAEVQNLIENKWGKRIYRSLMDDIGDMSLSKYTTRQDLISGILNTALNNWITAKIAYPTVFFRQLGQGVSYAENMNPFEWAYSVAKSLASPMQTMKFMMDGAGGYFDDRYRMGYNEASAVMMESTKSFEAKIGGLRNFFSVMSRMGDKWAQVFGGKGYVDKLIDDYKIKNPNASDAEAKESAFEEFKKFSIRTQQSRLESSRSRMQKQTNVGMRLFMSFANFSNQAARHVLNAGVAYRNGEISALQFAKIQTIYGVIMPVMYVAGGAVWNVPLALLAGGDKDEIIGDIIKQIPREMVTFPFSWFPVLENTADFAYGLATEGKKGVWNRGIVSIPMVDDYEKALKLLAKSPDTITTFDVLYALALLQEPVTSIPLGSIGRIYKKFDDGNKSGKTLIAH